MQSQELRERYIRFFLERGHRRIPSAPLLPENDPSVLFTTAGMHPLVPFLLGQPHPQGRRLVNFQRCIRTIDIDEVGDPSHLTFFEMLGNWSLGDYGKAESLAWSYEFLTRELNIDPARLAVTVFAGDQDAPRDETAADVWRSLGLPPERIHYLPKSDNWWGPVGATGPCGPDSEIFYDTGRPDHPGCGPGCACGKWFEIWNNVFLEYDRQPDGSYARLPRPNIDTGMGVERTLVALNGLDDVYYVDTIYPLVQAVERMSGRAYRDDPRPVRIIADHVRAAAFAAADGALPSNVEAGYVVRRLIRRAVRVGRQLGIRENFTAALSELAFDLFAGVYPELAGRRAVAVQALDEEETRFKETLERGLRHVWRVIETVRAAGGEQISGDEAFNLFETNGVPLELTAEIAAEAGLGVDQAGFQAAYERHKRLSRERSERRFAGGLAERSPRTTRLHTASHLLQAALRQVLGPGVRQMGSNITEERLRFDFTHPARLEDEQLAAVEALVNRQIARDLSVTMEVLPLQAALEQGALAFFGEKYGDQVNVYTIGDFSKEVCGGPHVTRTGELGRFRILKQEAVGKGVRRIRATLDEDE